MHPLNHFNLFWHDRSDGKNISWSVAVLAIL